MPRFKRYGDGLIDTVFGVGQYASPTGGEPYKIGCITYDGPPPECAECGFPMSLRSGKWGVFWSCNLYPLCNCSHSAHPNGKPTGSPATQEVREARAGVHRLMNQVMEEFAITRSGIYAYLRRETGLSEDACHVAKFDKQQCQVAENALNRVLASVANARKNLDISYEYTPPPLEKNYIGAEIYVDYGDGPKVISVPIDKEPKMIQVASIGSDFKIYDYQKTPAYTGIGKKKKRKRKIESKPEPKQEPASSGSRFMLDTDGNVNKIRRKIRL